MKAERESLLARALSAEAKAMSAIEDARREALKIDTDLSGIMALARKEIEGLTERLENVTADATSRALTVAALKADIEAKTDESAVKLAQAQSALAESQTSGEGFD